MPKLVQHDLEPPKSQHVLLRCCRFLAALACEEGTAHRAKCPPLETSPAALCNAPRPQHPRHAHKSLQRPPTQPPRPASQLLAHRFNLSTPAHSRSYLTFTHPQTSRHTPAPPRRHSTSPAPRNAPPKFPHHGKPCTKLHHAKSRASQRLRNNCNVQSAW